MIRMINEIKEEMCKQVNEFKDDTNKQLTEFKESSNKKIKTMQCMHKGIEILNYIKSTTGFKITDRSPTQWWKI
jgi:ABC-type Zn uptake system ZnuABC Zn-binding protein ZnuA